MTGAVAVRAALACATLAPAALAQVQVPSPNPLRPRPDERIGPMGVEGAYGPAQPVELADIAYNGASYQKGHVITRGVLDILEQGRYLSLTSGAARVMVIPLGPADYHDLVSLVGLDVTATGVVRVLPENQAVKPGCGLESKCEDPLLPELPNAQITWPPVSLTVWKVEDRGTTDRRPRGAP
ncbi:MAG TPA: hypothetical protein VMK65_10125, partial [Longimicrobiales bacterium]|nr:hypothetical protein [Longimicrobiales bacterium]